MPFINHHKILNLQQKRWKQTERPPDVCSVTQTWSDCLSSVDTDSHSFSSCLFRAVQRVCVSRCRAAGASWELQAVVRFVTSVICRSTETRTWGLCVTTSSPTLTPSALLHGFKIHLPATAPTPFGLWQSWRFLFPVDVDRIVTCNFPLSVTEL